MKQWVVLALMLALSPVATGEVVRAADSGFEIRIVVEVDASPDEAYAQFLAVDEWWDASHSWFGKAAGFSIDARAGGCFCETDDDRSALHMLVTFVEPGKKVAMTGGLGPLQGLGLDGAMSWNFEPLQEGGTRIVHVYRVTGYYPDGLQNLAGAVDGVQTGQVNRLAAKIRGDLEAYTTGD